MPTHIIYFFGVYLRRNYDIHWLVFVTETGCVYCAVRNKSRSAIQKLQRVNYIFKFNIKI